MSAAEARLAMMMVDTTVSVDEGTVYNVVNEDDVRSNCPSVFYELAMISYAPINMNVCSNPTSPPPTACHDAPLKNCVVSVSFRNRN